MQVDQLLHGYSDGHRLLAASRDLPRASKHLAATLSDMSGRSMVPGFEEYLTGYPLPEIDCFAFAKTWYAPEMKRPGCVWTHTLVVEFETLTAIRDLSALIPLFRRPSNQKDFGTYDVPAKVSADSIHRPFSFKGVAEKFLSALYAAPAAAVIVPVIDSLWLQDLVVAIWSQQWADLRAKFSFCTGSISSRTISGMPMDLQLIPRTSLREIRREVANVLLIEEHSTVATIPPPDSGWSTDAALDLAQPGPLRAFLSRAGHGLGERCFFEPLVELRMCGAELLGSFSEVVEVVARRFPQPSQARRLKSALLGPRAPIAVRLYEESESSVLQTLATTMHPDAFDPADLKIADRVQSLWHNDRSEGEWFADHLLSRDHNEFGEQMLAALVSTAPADQIATLFGSKPHLLLPTVRRDPELGTVPALWSGPADFQRELFDAAVGGGCVSESLATRIINAMLESGSDAAARQALDRFSDFIASVILDWFDHLEHGKVQRLGDGWRACLRARRADVASWVLASPRRKPASLALITNVLNPHGREMLSVDLDVWLAGVSAIDSMTEADRVQLCAFCLAIALDSTTPGSSDLARLTFDAVHTAAAQGQLSYDAWSWFEYHVPSLSTYRNWDRCERLRRGLIQHFADFHWPVRDFVHCAKKRETFDALMRTCYEYRPEGKHLLKRMSREAPLLEAEIPVEWRSKFRSYM